MFSLLKAIAQLVCGVMSRSGRPGSSAGRPGTASRPPAMKAGATGKRCNIFIDSRDVIYVTAHSFVCP